MTTEHLRFSTEMLRRLGEELNPHPEQGILELVRNAYDADASLCTVELMDAHRRGGTIRITDDGDGMGLDAIRDGWLVVGSSAKSRQKLTAKKRAPVGNKGIGRLAALRMGTAATLVTRPRAKPGVEYRLRLDWSAFDSAQVVDEVPLRLDSNRRPPNVASGSVVEIENLRVSLDAGKVRRLARALVLLANPFVGLDPSYESAGFRLVLRAPEFEELEQLVARRYFDEADFHLHGEIDKRGQASAWVRDYQGDVIFRAGHDELCSRKQTAYAAPPTVFDLWVFLLGGGRDSRFSPRAVTLTEIRKWLGEFGGVHLYHRGMRVSPYSDFDWLDMNLRRSQLQELRPSTNTSIGRIFVKDVEGRLKPKTDRVGFIEDETFQELRRFATDALEWLADRRLEQREARRDTEKAKTARQVKRAKKNVQQAVNSVPPALRQDLAQAVESLEKAKDREVHRLREDLQLYRTLCTVGATTAAFAHQAKSPLVQITSSAGTLADALQAQISAAQLPMLREMAFDIGRFAESLLSFSKVTLCLLQHEKRRRTAVSIHKAIEDVLGLIKPYLDLRDVKVQRELRAQRCSVLASQAALESILTNLLINSLQAFEQNHPGERLVVFQTDDISDPRRPSKKLVRLVVSDNGPGIKKLSVEDVWLPGKTTTAEGTGLGLTVVKDVVTELGGSVAAIAQGGLGGAEFPIDLPARGG